MGKIRDLTGQIFDDLIVERLAFQEHGQNAYWECVCICGKTKNIRGDSLTSGLTTSCGCAKRLDLVGKCFGKLTVKAFSHTSKTQQAYWICLCDCGNTKTIRGAHLTSEAIYSCGCVRSKMERDVGLFLMKNNIPFEREYKLERRDKKEGKRYLSVDFLVLYKSSVAIECQGSQHYKPSDFFGGTKTFQRQQERDKTKKELLHLMCIPRIEIRYDEKYIETFLTEQLAKYIV